MVVFTKCVASCLVPPRVLLLVVESSTTCTRLETIIINVLFPKSKLEMMRARNKSMKKTAIPTSENLSVALN